MKQLQMKDLLALTSMDAGRHISDGQSVQGEIRLLKANAGGTNIPSPISVHFKLIYRFDSKLRKVYLGAWPTNTLSEIRAQRDFYRGLLAQGIDPLAEIARQQELRSIEQEIENQRQLTARLEQQEQATNKLIEVQKRQERQTYREFFDEDFFPNVLKVGRADQGLEVTRSFALDVFPLIGEIPLEEVISDHVKLVLDTIGKRATKSQPLIRTKKKVLSDLRQSFTYAFQNDLIKTDPTQRISKKAIGKDRMGERVLSEQEIALLIQKLPGCDLSISYQLALLITLATGIRVADELLTARWKQVDFKTRIFHILEPKNQMHFQVHLSDYALSKFNALHGISGYSEWIFPSPRINGAHIDKKDLTKQVAARQRGNEATLKGRTRTQQNALELPLGSWRPHDLRRTMATIMVEIDISSDIADKCLNHIEKDPMRKTYILAKNKKAMKIAWDQFGEFLQSIEDEVHPHQLGMKATIK